MADYLNDNETPFLNDNKAPPVKSALSRKARDYRFKTLPILPLRNNVLFPGSVMPLALERPVAVQLIKNLMQEKNLIGIITQKISEIEENDSLFTIGTAARIVRLIKVSSDTYNVIIEGVVRFRVDSYVRFQPFILANVTRLEDKDETNLELNALSTCLRSASRDIIEVLPEIPTIAHRLLDCVTHPGHLSDIIGSSLDSTIEERQEILNTVSVAERMIKILEMINRQLEILNMAHRLYLHMRNEMDKVQKEYYLRQQLHAIKEELGDKEDNNYADMAELENRINLNALPEEVEKIARREMKRIQHMQPGQAEYSITNSYLDWLLEIPWNMSSKDNLDLNHAKNILNFDHYGLENIKKRIIEYLAVKKLKNTIRGPILCFVGPPGVGKTSLGRSIASALERKFYRISLGGVRDEAEIRGHRRTYVGALPGKIIKSIRKAGTNNPVILLDEVDKLGTSEFRGDPSSALLEVLDPEQNKAFEDHYLDVPFNLSNVLFISTANQIETIPNALYDRMEVIELSGYTLEEKISIAQKHLIPKQIKEHGIENKDISISKETISNLILSYTKEAGVRGLEREIATLCRAIAVDVSTSSIQSEQQDATVSTERIIASKDLETILGPVKFYNETAERTSVPGVATGLAWTTTGGELLFIEATKMEGKGALMLTGKLGDVMKESAQIALSWIKSHLSEIELLANIDKNFPEKTDIHIHFPAGAIPKDGPSAGIAIVSSVISLLTNKCTRSDSAMTGEITLRGLVLPVGGIKEKVLAAHRAGIKNLIIPERNEKDLIDIPSDIKSDLNFVFVKKIEEVLSFMLDLKMNNIIL